MRAHVGVRAARGVHRRLDAWGGGRPHRPQAPGARARAPQAKGVVSRVAQCSHQRLVHPLQLAAGGVGWGWHVCVRVRVRARGRLVCVWGGGRGVGAGANSNAGAQAEGAGERPAAPAVQPSPAWFSPCSPGALASLQTPGWKRPWGRARLGGRSAAPLPSAPPAAAPAPAPAQLRGHGGVGGGGARGLVEGRGGEETARRLACLPAHLPPPNHARKHTHTRSPGNRKKERKKGECARPLTGVHRDQHAAVPPQRQHDGVQQIALARGGRGAR